ncbi:MAG: CpaF family protein, partial [Candidatus Diapherotrites archaeon]|nr:CpaF family protein [Candidatus Diapherotrites archaeon]
MGSQAVEIKSEKLGESGSAEIFDGVPVSYYIVKNQLDLVEQKIVDFLVFAVTEGKEGLMDESVRQLIPRDFLEEFKKKILASWHVEKKSRFLDDQSFEELKQGLAFLFKSFAHALKNPVVVSEAVLDKLFGYGVLGLLMRDIDLEEIMVNGPDKNIFVYHKDFGMCVTNLVFPFKELDSFCQKIAASSGKIFDEKNPFLDARLPRGDRINICYSSITPEGITLTIRKFSPVPLSIVDLIANNTVSSEAAAFLWTMVEGINVSPANIIITGGAGSGKTTTLNVLTTFINRQERIITIEDPIELKLPNRNNWIQMEAWLSPGSEKKLSMDDLLRNSFRMRPDRIIVGE